MDPQVIDQAHHIVIDQKLLLAIFGSLFAALFATLKLLLVFLERRINEKFDFNEMHNRAQDRRLDAIDKDLVDYKQNIAIGVKEAQIMRESIKAIAESVTEHIKKEENITWAKIDSIAEVVNRIQIENERAHSGITERLASVETKMFNGKSKSR